MTATKVGDHDVIATERVRSPLWTEDKPMYWKTAVQLLLEDGSTMFGCVFCEYTDAKIGRIRHHQANDCLKNPKPSAAVTGEVMRGVAPARTHPDTKKAKLNGTKPKPAPPKPAPPQPVDVEINPDDLMAALELALGGNPKHEEENAQLREENRVLAAERDWWKDRYTALNQVLVSVHERLSSIR